jgi:peroxiredoxin
LSTQTSQYQKEARDRLYLPFELLSDAKLSLKIKLRLPTFEVSGITLYKRLTLISRDAQILKVFCGIPPEPERRSGAGLAPK